MIASLNGTVHEGCLVKSRSLSRRGQNRHRHRHQHHHRHRRPPSSALMGQTSRHEDTKGEIGQNNIMLCKCRVLSNEYEWLHVSTHGCIEASFASTMWLLDSAAY